MTTYQRDAQLDTNILKQYQILNHVDFSSPMIMFFKKQGEELRGTSASYTKRLDRATIIKSFKKKRTKTHPSCRRPVSRQTGRAYLAERASINEKYGIGCIIIIAEYLAIPINAAVLTAVASRFHGIACDTASLYAR